MNEAPAVDSSTKLISVSLLDDGDGFKELNPEYHYTAAKRAGDGLGRVQDFHPREDGQWLITEGEINFRVVSNEAATRILNAALDDNYIVAFLHLSTQQTGAVGRKGAVIKS